MLQGLHLAIPLYSSGLTSAPPNDKCVYPDLIALICASKHYTWAREVD